jgi:O-antigen ligase
MEDRLLMGHRQAEGGWRSPIVVVMTASLGVMLWHGGYRAPAQLLLGAVAAVAVVWLRPSPARLRNPIVLGLAVTSAANLASLLWHRDRSSIAPVVALLAVLAVAAIAADTVAALRARLALIVVCLGLAVATTGIAGLVLQTPPLAERIAGVWRAQGTLEYPPALGLLCVCALAAALALHATDTLEPGSTVVVCAILVGAVVASFDRVAAIETALVLALFAVRAPAVRRAVGMTLAVAAGCGLVALAISHPSRAALERHLRHGPISSRSDVWHAAWRAAERRPALGYGPGRFTAIYETRPAVVLEPAAVTQAHDAVLEQAVEAGVLAAAGAALVLAAMLVIGAQALVGRDPATMAYGTIAVAVALSGLYDFTWSFPPLLLLGAVAAVVCTRADRSGQPIRRTRDDHKRLW